MPADEYFEAVFDQIRRMSPGDPRNERSPWGDIPREDRPAWCRAILDFPTHFPGATVMTFAAREIRSGGVATLHAWAEQAAAFHRIGCTAADWYLLRLCVDRRLERLLAREDGRFVIDTKRSGYRSIALIAEHWTDWLPLLASGLTPLRALDLIVDGDRRSWPGGRVIDGDGNLMASA
jgi:hypothetical protein